MIKNFVSILFLLPLTISCQNIQMPLQTGTLPEWLNESSGLELHDQYNYWTHNDGDGPLNLYKIDKYGNLELSIEVMNVEVKDVEDAARDDKGNIYLGDFGNNKCERKKFKIIKTQLPEGGFSFPVASEIVFTLPGLVEFPPAKNDRNWDIEAMFHYDGWLYLFTRDRSDPFLGYTKMYKVPDDEGRYDATYVGKIMTAKDGSEGSITSADISPDGKRVVLLANDGLYLLSQFKGYDFHRGMNEYIPFTFKSEKEAVLFTDDCTLVITDEYVNKKGGKIYTMDLCTEIFKQREKDLKK